MQYSIFILWLLFVGCETEPKPLPKNYLSKHNEALAYCKQNDFNTSYYILIDMSLHSGRNRFFVYNFSSKKNEYEKLVTHGSCDVLDDNDSKWEKAKFSNVNDSHCSSKGKYKIGKRDYSSWGINVKYWLVGLEKTNDNSEKRVTVLHSWDAVKDKEIYPDYAPLSWGCPAISNDFMTVLDKKLQLSTKPVLMWIIE
ncbi:MAG: murein L,D-transpeptidase catalytic domain family protein [Bacteroidota bacterium]